MISLINTDLAKGRGKTPKKQTNKTPKQLYTVGKQKGNLFKYKKFWDYCYTDFWCVKDPKRIPPEKNPNHQNRKSPGPNVLGKQVFQDRNLQPEIVGPLVKTVHFLSHQGFCLSAQRPGQQQGCGFPDCHLLGKSFCRWARTASRSKVVGNASTGWKKTTSRRKLTHHVPQWKGRRATPTALHRPCWGAGVPSPCTKGGGRWEGAEQERIGSGVSEEKEKLKWTTCVCFNYK